MNLCGSSSSRFARQIGRPRTAGVFCSAASGSIVLNVGRGEVLHSRRQRQRYYGAMNGHSVVATNLRPFGSVPWAELLAIAPSGCQSPVQRPGVLGLASSANKMIVTTRLSLDIVRYLNCRTHGTSHQWTTLREIADRIYGPQDIVFSQAIDLAKCRGWIIVEGKSASRRACLTKAGSSLVLPT